ncbi:ATP-binding cassette domain-containing protein [Maribacter confluentis]|uniref:ATP-binding cassette domain-containing protein n=1 Tax=Maribacter confluentis TaxID=1656093 RepID=A0ABT8RS84_9FLAO|nr:ATP-binding cassette domain-containing protein [Maribacter confluentis]MDO1513783.1 ATP-binding cassette domain-containing protein [Maribacter confluentis]
MNHWVIYINNNSNKKDFFKLFNKGSLPKELREFQGKTGCIYSSFTLEKLIDEEDRHDRKIISTQSQSLETMSSGEQKKALLHYLLQQKPDYIILDNPFDNLDIGFQKELQHILLKNSISIAFVQIASRTADTLSFMNKFGKLEGSLFSEITSPEALRTSIRNTFSSDRIPKPLKIPIPCNNALVKFKDVTINYGNRPILKNINWTINPGDFWQLTGPNGSGKSTLLSMITGDNPKAYGQDIYLFGTKKGSGESVWDIKEKIGYYSPAMTNKFSGRHTIEYMLISGLTDSVGLYTIPTESQKRVVREWLYLLDLFEEKDIHFNKLSTGKQRLVMTARAMVKHPPLLILDEPTAGMDDVSATLLVELVNKIAEETTTAIIFVSHRKEPFLEPKDIFSLSYSNDGSKGLISKT